MQKNAKTATHQDMKKKTVTSAPSWKTAYRSGTSQTPKRKLSKLTNKDEDDHPLRASEMHEPRNPARPIHQNIPNINETIRKPIKPKIERLQQSSSKELN